MKNKDYYTLQDIDNKYNKLTLEEARKVDELIGNLEKLLDARRQNDQKDSRQDMQEV